MKQRIAVIAILCVACVCVGVLVGSIDVAQAMGDASQTLDTIAQQFNQIQ